MTRRFFVPLAALTLLALPLAGASFAQQTVKPASAPVLCAVKGEELPGADKAAGHATYNGKTYYFCCAACAARWSKSTDTEKARYAHLTALRTDKIVLQKRLSAVEAELKSAEAKPVAAPKPVAPKPVAATPIKAASVFCAVTDEEIDNPEAAAGGKSVYNGKTYYFCCAGCKPQFDAAPAKFAALAQKKAAARAAK